MADDRERQRQFDYSAMSSKVLSGDKGKSKDPSGEAETLRGRMKGNMGDLALRTKPPIQPVPSVPPASTSSTPFTRPKGLLYYPKLRETRDVYETLLNMCQPLLGDQPDDVLKAAVDEILAILKAENVPENDRKRDLECLLGPLSLEDFSKFFSLSKQLLDYQVQPDLPSHTNPTEVQIPVIFTENQVVTESEQVVLPSDDEEILPSQPEIPSYDTSNPQPTSIETVNPWEIDGFWLWRKLENALGSIEAANEVEKDVLNALKSNERVCETQLVQILGFEKLDLVRFLIKNKGKIVVLTRLGRAKSEEEKKEIRKEMESSEEGREILRKLTEKMDVEKTKIANLTDKVNQIDVNMTTRTLFDLKELENSIKTRSIQAQESVILPPGAQETAHKGFDEICIPAPLSPALSHHSLLKITDLPEWIQGAFPRVKELNAIQSRVYPVAFESRENMLVCAPTGAGKTNIALMTILKEMDRWRKGNGTVDCEAFKVVYVAPMKALVAEVCGNLRNRLEPYGLEVRELTGDSHLSKDQIKSTQVLITTPEKWDIITRKSGDRTFTEQVRLMIIDEVHLLHDSRGPVLEALVARVLRGLDSRSEEVRLVGLSATLPNYEDVGKFLRVGQKGLFFFDRNYRPVPLEQKFIGITENKAVRRMLLLNEICYDQVFLQAGKNQVLVFVHSRRETVKTAKMIKETAVSRQELGRFLREESKSKEVLVKLAETVVNQDLRELLPFGFAVHHAGLPVEDRRLVEDLFAGRHIQVLVSTATLAWGVNLPAHKVIIKGTQVYSPERGCWVELSPQDMMQMLGRAGRIDYDEKGEGVVITSHTQLRYYLSLMNMQLPIESQFLSQLPDHLNAEISLGNIATLHDGVNWLSYTYFYIRLLRAPSLYPPSQANDTSFIQFRTDLIHSAAVVLDKAGLIKYDKTSGVLIPTSLGKVAACYYLRPDSISIYNEHLKAYMGPIDLLRLFGLSLEFKYIPVREEEKQEVAKLMERVPYPVKGAMDEPASKMNVLLQAYISGLRLSGYTLMSDMVYVSQSAGRIMRALFEVAMRRGWAQLTFTALDFCKMIEHRMWVVMNPLRQFHQLPDDILLKLEKKEGLEWERFFDLTEQQISELLKGPKYAGKIHGLIHAFPRLQAQPYVLPLTRSCLKVELVIRADFTWDVRIHGNRQLFWVFVEDGDSELLLHSEQFVLKRKYSDQDHMVVFTVPYFEQQPPNYFIRLVSDQWLRSETLIPLSFKQLILPQKNPPPSELAFETLVPVSALRWPEVEQTYTFTTFNKIQSNVFSAVYENDGSVLIGAPPGSGRSTIGELAVLRHLAQETTKVLYVVGAQGQVEHRVKELNKRLETSGIQAVMLTGSLVTDLALISERRLIVTSPEQWDHISRRWRQRKPLHDLGLLVADDLHLLGEPGGAMEVVISRSRFMACQLEQRLRIVGVMVSVGNAGDVAEWLGISQSRCFNYPPDTATIPLSLTFHGFDQNLTSSRLLAMSRPLYQAITSLSPSDPVIVYVPDRKTARIIALDLLAYSAGDERPGQFLHSATDIPSVTHKVLAHTLASGVSFVYEGMQEKDTEVAIEMYRTGAVQVMVVTVGMGWRVRERAKLVAVVDTMKYEGREKHYVDYSIAEVLNMMGRTGHPSIDTHADFVLFCHTPKKDFYKKFLREPIPLESHLDHYLNDHFNAEIVAKTITSKQDAVDWLTWTFLYRRLVQNPNYYGLQGASGAHLNAYLSESVEKTLEELTKTGLVEENEDINALNPGIIAAYYYLKTATLQVFAESLTASLRVRGLIEVLAAAQEYETVAVRHGDDRVLREISRNLWEPVESEVFNEPHVKAKTLLLAHCQRLPLPSDLAHDQKGVVEVSGKLVHAMVDMLASFGWLKPALLCMTLSQQLIQAVTDRDSPLSQLPHFPSSLVTLCLQSGINDLVDLMNMEDDQRRSLLSLTDEEIADVARVCNSYPSLTMRFRAPDTVNREDTIKVQVNLERDGDPAPVYAPYYPLVKEEGWWAVIGDPQVNRLYAIKKFSLGVNASLVLTFPAPDPGTHQLTMYLMSDCYVGADQGEQFSLRVSET